MAHSNQLLNRVWHIMDWMDRLLGGAGKDPAVMVQIGTNDKVRWNILKKEFRDLGDILKKSIPWWYSQKYCLYL